MAEEGDDASSQAWRAGEAAAKSRLGQRLFSLGGSRSRAALLLFLALLLLLPSGWIVVGDATARERPWAPAAWRTSGAEHAAPPPLLLVVAALFLAAPAGLFFLRLAWREMRGAVVVWQGALELHARGRSRFWPWARGRAWRRADAFDLVVAFATSPEAPSESVVISCESQAQREAIVARLIESDVAADPWLDDPRRFG
ncbi:MAG: hypothetical protein JNL90_05355 [Planctomycetes bacterium]|nr:hypothetical protein [Planctomycetota bacterium]